MRTIKDIIEDYQKKIDKCDKSIEKIIGFIREARHENRDEVDIDDLREEKANCNRDRQLYVQFIKDLEDIN
jgi:hypothetical protein